MADPETELWLVRHGETEWSRDGRHTSVTDLPLTESGVVVAKTLAERLDGLEFGLVLTSPRQRARRTAELAGFTGARPEPDLVEWDYGDYEGLTTEQIRESVPGWTVWTHPCPGG
ncbi:MAG TPA: histidine phosphatase family protein, partial [Nocardioidaceae bacterium]|nr:histidine phosphatase family protein [Nocardioidaceae bacterium]